MSLEICRCCAGKMTESSPRNPNICVSCEQLLEDDGMRLDALLASVPNPDPENHPNEQQEVFAHELHETFSTSI
jgi:hypothetical protein